MALDAIAVRAVTEELKKSIIGGRIDKIHQPEKDEICIHIRTYEENFRLVLSASSSQPRVHLTSTQKENPKTPPMFCMLLRKHLGSGKITGVEQIGFERIVEFTIESYDELGDLTEKKLIVEIMGRHSNIILTNSENKIIDCIKHIDFTISSVRQVLPGIMYEYPPAQEKTPLSDIDENVSVSLVQRGKQMKKAILDSVSGISPLTAAELIYSVSGSADLRCEEVSDINSYQKELYKLKQKTLNNEFTPCLIIESSTGKILDFSAVDIKQYEALAEIKYFETINEAMESFYTGRDKAERMKQKSAGLVKLLNTNIERCSKKLVILTNTLSEAKNKEQQKIFGDLITASLYNINPGDKEIEVQNFYEPDYPIVKIKLDPSRSPNENAQLYYKKYRKLKNAELEVQTQLEENKKNLDYLESTLVAVENAESESDLNAIRSELAEEGYLKRVTAKKTARQAASKPMHFVSEDGFDIYIGKNNTQNDYLTLKFANSNDIWFHTKNIHGSHVIIKLGIDKDVPENTMRQAARAAAYFSKGRQSSQVAVDYTFIKNVKKPNGAKPGMVIYDSYNTVYVTPEEPKDIS